MISCKTSFLLKEDSAPWSTQVYMVVHIVTGRLKKVKYKNQSMHEATIMLQWVTATAHRDTSNVARYGGSAAKPTFRSPVNGNVVRSTPTSLFRSLSKREVAHKNVLKREVPNFK